MAPFLFRIKEVTVTPPVQDQGGDGPSDPNCRAAGGGPRKMADGGTVATPPSTVRAGSAKQVASGLGVGGADVLDEGGVGRREGGDPVELAGARHLVLEVDEALQGLLVGVEAGQPGGLGAFDEALGEVADALGGVLVGGGVDAHGGGRGSGLRGHDGLHTL